MPESLRLGDAVSPEVPASPLVAVPMGSVEQHGPHLPLDTDTRIAAAVADALVSRRSSSGEAAYRDHRTLVLAPPLAFGDSGEHHGFPGTISIGPVVLRALLVELVKSAALWAPRVLFLTGHGGNVPALTGAVAELRGGGHDVAWTSCGIPGGDAHAGRTETSLLLHLAPETVRLDKAAPGDTRPLPELLPHLRSGGVRAVAPNGVLGDPTGADAAEGALMFAGIVDRVLASIALWRVGASGALAEARP